MDRVYLARFKAAGPRAQRIALCVMHGESGGNPGAISATSDYGGAQFNRPSWERSYPHWWQPGRGFRYLIFDPWFGASQMWMMSKGGTSWSPWYAYWNAGCDRL